MCSEILEILSPWIPLPNSSLHWAQRPHPLLPTPSLELLTSSLAFWSLRFWSEDDPYTWQTPHWFQSPFSLPWPSSDLDNEGVILLPPILFICIINTFLSDYVQSASTDDLLILQTLQSMDGSISPAFCSHLSDWQHKADILTYKGHVYIFNYDFLHYAILKWCHDHVTIRHPDYLKTHQLVATEF